MFDAGPGVQEEVTWADAPAVHVFTNTVVVTNTVPAVMERTSMVYVTNAATGAVSGYVAREPVATNLVALAVTNFVPVFDTNVVQVPVTNLVAKPEAEAAIRRRGRSSTPSRLALAASWRWPWAACITATGRSEPQGERGARPGR